MVLRIPKKGPTDLPKDARESDSDSEEVTHTGWTVASELEAMAVRALLNIEYRGHVGQVVTASLGESASKKFMLPKRRFFEA
jgi:hypothetical protein